LCWISTTVGRPQPASSVVLGDFSHSQHRSSVMHIGLQLLIIKGVQCRRWNFRKADWASYTLATERSIPLIPVNKIRVEESYQHFCGAMQKASRHSIPRGFRPTYTPCLDEECQDLLKQYEESLDLARRHHWEELTSKMNFTHSSRKSWGTDTLLNNHPSQLIRQSAPMPLLLISSRLLKHCMTRSLNASFVCMAELFCSRCQTRVFLIHSLTRFQLLCRRRNQQ